MIDRLEELLALLEEEEAEEQEDVLALRLGAGAHAPPVSEDRIEKRLEEKEALMEDGEEMYPASEDENAPAEAEELDWISDVRAVPEWMTDEREVPLKRQDEIPEAGGGIEVGAAEARTAGNGAAEFLWDELAQAVMGSNGIVVLRRPGAGDVEMTELAGAAKETVPAEEMSAVMDALTSAERGLEGLYRQTVQASRPEPQKLPVEQAGRTVRAEEPGRTAALTVDELDRAVRRDSRRYDGGMTIF